MGNSDRHEHGYRPRDRLTGVKRNEGVEALERVRANSAARAFPKISVAANTRDRRVGRWMVADVSVGLQLGSPASRRLSNNL